MVLKEIYKDVKWFAMIVVTLIAQARNSAVVPAEYIVQKHEREQVETIRNKANEFKKHACLHPDIKKQRYANCSNKGFNIQNEKQN